MWNLGGRPGLGNDLGFGFIWEVVGSGHDLNQAAAGIEMSLTNGNGSERHQYALKLTQGYRDEKVLQTRWV